MPSKTNTDRIVDSEKEIVRLSTDFNNVVERSRSVEDVLRAEIHDLSRTLSRIEVGVSETKIRLNQLEKFDPTRASALEQRVIRLEKLLDESRTRRWQVWLAFLSAAMSAIVALTVAFAKR